MTIRLHLLGTGTPILDLQRPATTAILLEIGPEKLLFDAGRGVTTQLLKQAIHPATVGPIFITHHHYDHICNLGDLLLTAWHNGRVQPIHVFGPPGTSNIVEALFSQVYARDITFTLFNEKDRPDIRQLVQVIDASPGLVYESSQWRVLAEYVNHGNSLGLSEADWPCLGYRLEAYGKVVAIGGDTVACPGLEKLAHHADVLILSCYLADQEVEPLSFEKLANHVIASSGQVGKIAAQSGVRKLVLTHFRPKSVELMISLAEDIAKNFNGELHIGEDLMTIAV